MTAESPDKAARDRRAEAELAAESEVYAGLIELVARIRSGESDGMAELYAIFAKGIVSICAANWDPGTGQ